MRHFGKLHDSRLRETEAALQEATKLYRDKLDKALSLLARLRQETKDPAIVADNPYKAELLMQVDALLREEKM